MENITLEQLRKISISTKRRLINKLNQDRDRLKINMLNKPKQLSEFVYSCYDGWNRRVKEISYILTNIDSILNHQLYLILTDEPIKSIESLFRVDDNLYLVVTEMEKNMVYQIFERYDTAYWLGVEWGAYDAVEDFFPEHIESFCNNGWMPMKYLRKNKLSKLNSKSNSKI